MTYRRPVIIHGGPKEDPESLAIAETVWEWSNGEQFGADEHMRRHPQLKRDNHHHWNLIMRLRWTYSLYVDSGILPPFIEGGKY